MRDNGRDPYVYPGTEVLRNREDIRDAAALASFERLASAQRQAEPLPPVSLDPAGYRALHRHLFQDVYDWAGCDRTVDIAKGNSYFCKAPYIERELASRFAAIRAEDGLRRLPAAQFAARAAEHLGELNAIHPFREGNGRTMRAFLDVLARRAGHEVDLARIEPKAWLEASIQSFQSSPAGLRSVIAGAIKPRELPQEQQADDRDARTSERQDGDNLRPPPGGRGR